MSSKKKTIYLYPSSNQEIMMHRYFIEMAYNGTPFHGWQVQPNAVSVQAVVDDALSKLLRIPVHVVGAGRTDTGVHASYFVAHFDISIEIDNPAHFLYKVNRILPRDVVVYSIQEVDQELHSRFSAISRTYHYNLVLLKNPFKQETAYLPVYNLDFDLMNQAAQLLFDYTDFTSFSKLHTDVKTNNCTVMLAHWHQIGDHEWQFVIRADRFLRNMVRAIVGTLLDVGRGKITLEDFKKVIEEKNRGGAGSSAPAHALFLVDIAYPEGAGFVPMTQQLILRKGC